MLYYVMVIRFQSFFSLVSFGVVGYLAMHFPSFSLLSMWALSSVLVLNSSNHVHDAKEMNGDMALDSIISNHS